MDQGESRDRVLLKSPLVGLDFSVMCYFISCFVEICSMCWMCLVLLCFDKLSSRCFECCILSFDESCWWCRDGIVTWIKKKTGPGVYNITTTEEAEKILTSERKVVLAYLDSLTVIYLFFVNLRCLCIIPLNFIFCLLFLIS